MNSAKPLAFHAFGPEDPLAAFADTPQTRYLRCYLNDLGAVTVLEEPNYFDRDYLSEFIAFYAASSRGYPNICRRLHFFSIRCTRRLLRSAAGGSRAAKRRLQDAYLGFAVIRPLPAAPYGRTVLRWYPEGTGGRPPRLTAPKRPYTCHVAGVDLVVEGLA